MKAYIQSLEMHTEHVTACQVYNMCSINSHKGKRRDSTHPDYVHRHGRQVKMTSLTLTEERAVR